MNLELPEKNNASVKTLNEIVSMDKIIDNKNNYYIEEIDENNDEEEEKKEIKDENYKNINDILLKKKIITLKYKKIMKSKNINIQKMRM